MMARRGNDDAVLRAENLKKAYGKKVVVRGVSLELAKGEIVGLLGPNGAGKTTTFYIMTGRIKPNDGQVFLKGTDITDFPMYRRAREGIGYLAQEPSIFARLSVEDNLKLVLEMTDLTASEREENWNRSLRISLLPLFGRTKDTIYPEGRDAERKYAEPWFLSPISCCWTNPLPESIPSRWKTFRESSIPSENGISAC